MSKKRCREAERMIDTRLFLEPLDTCHAIILDAMRRSARLGDEAAISRKSFCYAAAISIRFEIDFAALPAAAAEQFPTMRGAPRLISVADSQYSHRITT